MSKYFPYTRCLGEKVKVELDLANHATKSDFKNVADVYTSKFAENTDLVNLKSDEDKLDIDKFEDVSSGSSSLKSRENKLDISKLKTTSVI